MIPTMEENCQKVDLIVVGGGLAGLTAAALVAREGRSVVLVERSSRLGGRAMTQESQGVHFNLGPHALYCAGHAFRLLTALQVPFAGRIPAAGRALLLGRTATYTLPHGLVSLLTSRLLTLREKWRLSRILSELPHLDARLFDDMPLGVWIENNAGTGHLADQLGTLFRLSTFANAPEQTSAGAALDQLKLALAGNVWYLDGGWQTLVDGLRERAIASGADVRTSERAESVRDDADGVIVRLAGGAILHGRALVLAIPPKSACELLDEPPLARWHDSSVPVRAACLDVALDRLPRPERRFALGLEDPTYYSVHSATARLAPDGVAVLHVMKYLGCAVEEPAGVVERELEAVLDRLQPGWGDRVIERRFLPGMTVAHALPSVADRGLAGRPGVAIPGRPCVFLAGDWVGDRGMLADASAASAEEAARSVLDGLEHVSSSGDRSVAHAGA
ncbi:MAG: FAD-dependent oxidoreductase [Isosphaeraceae bacterium]|nr:FAD-dependent oxidoreductase [Isosphaeraceae bacterium]